MHSAESPCPRILAHRPPRIAMLFVVLATVVDWLLGRTVPPLASSATAAITVAAAGCLLMIRAWWLFRVAGTAICPTETARKLITADVFRWTRNPMYLGMVLMMIGLALYTGSLFHYAAAIAFFGIVDHSFCPYEEQRLAQTFAADYSRYASKTRRWL